MKCFYHNDLDGHCAGYLVAISTINNGQEDFFEVDYTEPIPIEKISDGETVYFVDYSFKKSTIDLLKYLINDKKCEVFWIDHHTSSIDLQNDPEYAWTKEIPGIRDNRYSGAMLTYYYISCILGSDLDEEAANAPMPIRLVDDYDCWKYNLEDTIYFKLGMDMVENDVFDKIWEELFYVEGSLSSVIKQGKQVKKYIDMDNKNYRDAYAYESIIRGYKCIVINRKSNSWIFGEKYNEYPLVMVWAYNGKIYSYSIFSSNPDVNCKEIAESYGGGGHKGAAGFTLDHMPFVGI